jgi:hypothetical protein
VGDQRPARRPFSVQQPGNRRVQLIDAVQNLIGGRDGLARRDVDDLHQDPQPTYGFCGCRQLVCIGRRPDSCLGRYPGLGQHVAQHRPAGLGQVDGREIRPGRYGKARPVPAVWRLADTVRYAGQERTRPGSGALVR